MNQVHPDAVYVSAADCLRSGALMMSEDGGECNKAERSRFRDLSRCLHICLFLVADFDQRSMFRARIVVYVKKKQVRMGERLGRGPRSED